MSEFVLETAPSPISDTFCPFDPGGIWLSRFCPLFSSSSGNSIYIGGSDGGILVDAGVSARQLTESLNRLEIPLDSIRAILITHEHSDHVKGLRVFAKRMGVPVYTSPGTAERLRKNGTADGSFSLSEIACQPFESTGMRITPFHISHDCAEGYGYVLELPDSRRAAVVTDLGQVTPEVLRAVSGCDLVLLESNHDFGMLRNGPYPLYLKQRILSKFGHLSNQACAETALRLMEAGTTRFFLGHLSRQNNTPQLARQATRDFLIANGAQERLDFMLEVAPESGAERVMIF